MENQERTLFGIGGVGGMLVATVLLLIILAVLTCLGITAQQNVMQKPYERERGELSGVKMFETYDVESNIMRSKE